jgi:hypothetical protein
MSKNDPSSEPDPLSATGMFLRAFESKAEPAESAPAQRNAAVVAPDGSGAGGEPPQVAPAAASEPAPQSGPGEFTRLFQSRAAEIAAAREFVEPSAPLANQSAQPHPLNEPGPASEPGEFTRIFLSGPGREQAPPKIPDDGQRTRVPAVAPGRAKGFSSPGASDSASAAGSVTQLFRPIAPGSHPSMTTPEPSPKDSAAFSPGAAPPYSSSPSVTNLIESLASPGGSPREPEIAERPVYSSEPPPLPSSRNPVPQCHRRQHPGLPRPRCPPWLLPKQSWRRWCRRCW